VFKTLVAFQTQGKKLAFAGFFSIYRHYSVSVNRPANHRTGCEFTRILLLSISKIKII